MSSKSPSSLSLLALLLIACNSTPPRTKGPERTAQCAQVVTVDALDDVVPLLIHGVRVHRAEDSAGDRRHRVTVPADIGGKQNGVRR